MQSSLLSIQIKESDQEVERQHADTNGGCCGSEILPVGHKDLLNSGYSYIDVVTFIILTINNLGCFFLAIVLSSKLRSDNWEFFSNWHVLMVTMVSEDLLLRIGTIIIVEAIIFLPKPWDSRKRLDNEEEHLSEVDFQVVEDDALTFEHYEGACRVGSLVQLSNAYYRGMRPGMKVVSVNKYNLIDGTEAAGLLRRSLLKREYAWVTVLMTHDKLKQVSIEVPTKLKLTFNQQLRVFSDLDEESVLYKSGVRKNWRLVRAGKFFVNSVSEYDRAMHTLRHTKNVVPFVFRPHGGIFEIPYLNEDVRISVVGNDKKTRESIGGIRASFESGFRGSTPIFKTPDDKSGNVLRAIAEDEQEDMLSPIEAKSERGASLTSSAYGNNGGEEQEGHEGIELKVLNLDKDRERSLSRKGSERSLSGSRTDILTTNAVYENEKEEEEEEQGNYEDSKSIRSVGLVAAEPSEVVGRPRKGSASSSTQKKRSGTRRKKGRRRKKAESGAKLPIEKSGRKGKRRLRKNRIKRALSGSGTTDPKSSNPIAMDSKTRRMGPSFLSNTSLSKASVRQMNQLDDVVEQKTLFSLDVAIDLAPTTRSSTIARTASSKDNRSHAFLSNTSIGTSVNELAL